MTETLAPETQAADEPPSPADPGPPAAKRRGRWRRRLGTFLIVFGVLALAYGATIYFWRDPVTDLYNRWKQSQLAGQLDSEVAEFRASVGLPVVEASGGSSPEPQDAPAAPAPIDQEAVAAETKRLAQRFYDQLEPGQALGRIVIRKLGLNAVVVNGTQWGRDLSRGPGRYPETSIPGLGELTAIAGHRTTFGAPFRHIDDLKAGDTITLKLPYGTFTYRVFKHEIVDDEDWSIIRERGFDTLVLSACHPLYSASQRWVVYARLQKAELPNGDVWQPSLQRAATAAPA